MGTLVAAKNWFVYCFWALSDSSSTFMNLHHGLCFLSVGLACMTIAGAGHAFCRQTTCDPEAREEPCDKGADGCITEGETLFYRTPCLGFAIAEGSAERLGFSDKEFLELADRAIERWASVDCGDGENPGFHVEPGLIVQSDRKFFCENAPELNLSVWSFEDPWPYPDAEDSLGFTTSVFNADSGEVFDADIELNLPKIASSVMSREEREQQVLTIVTHEVGHYLGLAHSDEPGAVMAARYTDSDLLNKPLTQDDIDGICEIFPPGGAPESCSAIGVSEAALDPTACDAVAEPSSEGGGCSLAAHSRPAGGLPWVVGLVLGLACFRRYSVAPGHTSFPRGAGLRTGSLGRS